MWWLCTPYLFIDASTDAYEEEEGDYEEEEEHCASCTNQVKLIPMQAIPVQTSKDTIEIYLGSITIPSPYFASLLLIQVFL